jgi:hypothetical protein
MNDGGLGQVRGPKVTVNYSSEQVLVGTEEAGIRPDDIFVSDD